MQGEGSEPFFDLEDLAILAARGGLRFAIAASAPVVLLRKNEAAGAGSQ